MFAGILEAIETAWSPAGVAILVDLGGGGRQTPRWRWEMLREDRRGAGSSFAMPRSSREPSSRRPSRLGARRLPPSSVARRNFYA